jgi:hypothetical protein
MPELRVEWIESHQKMKGDTVCRLFFENVAMEGRLQSENPKILEALKKISA